MKRQAIFLVLAVVLWAGFTNAEGQPQRSDVQGPPPLAYEDCKGKKAGDTVKHTTPDGVVDAVCEDSPKGLVARPKRSPNAKPSDRPRQSPQTNERQSSVNRQNYSLEQAISDQAQLHTIAFNGLAFLTGDFGSATFLPHGKIADFFGFQYMRDIDTVGKGHNPIFLDRIAGSVLGILSEGQRGTFLDAARAQDELMREIAVKRFPLIAAFYQQIQNNPSHSRSTLDRAAVLADCADLFELDVRLAYNRAKVFGALAISLTSEQKQALGRLKFGDFSSWPNVEREDVRSLLPRGASKLTNVGYMTLASEFFSWYAGSIEADTYFCPERHGTYFGGFYMKDMPAMGKNNYDISMSITGDAGSAFLAQLSPSQRALLADVVQHQRKTLNDIVEVRRTISTRLRGFLTAQNPSESEVMALGRRYGELDGELAYQYAIAFSKIASSLDQGQKERIRKLRTVQNHEEGSAFLFSDRIAMPTTPDSSFLFKVGQ